jgi:hypothetical protein
MKTTINLKMQGVKGGDPQWQANKGYIATHIEGKENGSISIDAFEGQGETYKRREIPLITIFHGGKLVYEDNFSRFIEKLQKPEPQYFLFGETSCRNFFEMEFNDFIQDAEDNGLDGITFEWDGANVADLLSAMDGWGSYSFLTKAEYEKINEL